MAVDLSKWRQTPEDVVAALADEAMQRRSWFGSGPEVWSPDEAFCQFFDDAAAEDFFNRDDTGLSKRQFTAGKHLVKSMRELSDQTPDHVAPADLIDDPRWQEIRNAAARFRRLLQTGNIAA